MAKHAKSVVQTLRRFLKKPWEITGPCASPEYLEALPLATEVRQHCPASFPGQAAIIPTSDPETVFDIKYYPRDLRRVERTVTRTVLRKADVEKMMAEKTEFQFPKAYLTKTVEEDYSAVGGGYQK